MAIELKQGKTLEDPRNKDVNVNDPYGVVTQVNINHSKKSGLILIEVYPRVCNREERNSLEVLPVLSYAEGLTPELYDTFFSKELFADGMNPQKAGYKMFASLHEKVMTTDKDGKTTTKKVFKYSDWQSDEE